MWFYAVLLKVIAKGSNIILYMYCIQLNKITFTNFIQIHYDYGYSSLPFITFKKKNKIYMSLLYTVFIQFWQTACHIVTVYSKCLRLEAEGPVAGVVSDVILEAEDDTCDIFDLHEGVHYFTPLCCLPNWETSLIWTAVFPSCWLPEWWTGSQWCSWQSRFWPEEETSFF